MLFSGPVHTNPFSNETELFFSVFKKICVHNYRFRRVVFACPHYNTASVWKRSYTLSAHAQMNSTHAHFNISSAILDTHGRVVWCPVCLLLVFSKSIVFKSLHSGERFRMAPFSFENGLVWTGPQWTTFRQTFPVNLFFYFWTFVSHFTVLFLNERGVSNEIVLVMFVCIISP